MLKIVKKANKNLASNEIFKGELECKKKLGKIVIGGSRDGCAYSVLDQRTILNPYLLDNLEKYEVIERSPIHQKRLESYPDDVKYILTGNIKGQVEFHIEKIKEIILEGNNVYVDKIYKNSLIRVISKDPFFEGISLEINQNERVVEVPQPTKRGLAMLIKLFGRMFSNKYLVKRDSSFLYLVYADLMNDIELNHLTKKRLDRIVRSVKWNFQEIIPANNMFDKILETIESLHRE